MPPRAAKSSKWADWTSKAEAILIDVRKGTLLNRTNSDNNVQLQVYNDISVRLMAAGFGMDAEQVQNWWTRVCSLLLPLSLLKDTHNMCLWIYQFKSAFKICLSLRTQFRFGWDDTHRYVTATDSVWDNSLLDQVHHKHLPHPMSRLGNTGVGLPHGSRRNNKKRVEKGVRNIEYIGRPRNR